MKMTIRFNGLNVNKEWPHFAWTASINGVSFEYKTGIGHAYIGSKQSALDVVVNSDKDYLAGQKVKGFRDAHSFRANAYAVRPSEDDILQALFSDAECGAYSFDEFCDNLGYSNDSLKALDTYRACMETAKKLRQCLGKDYQETAKRIQELSA